MTFGLLLCALALSVTWFVDTPSGRGRLEPAVESIGFCGALIGIFVDRFAVRQERRHQTLLGIGAELAENEVILVAEAFGDPPHQAGRPLIYPRLRMSAVETALATGALIELADDRLLELIHAWRDAVLDFNHRLDLTELRSFGVGAQDESRALHYRMTRNGGPVDRLRRQRNDIARHLRTTYGREDAIRRTLPLASAPDSSQLGPAA